MGRPKGFRRLIEGVLEARFAHFSGRQRTELVKAAEKCGMDALEDAGFRLGAATFRLQQDIEFVETTGNPTVPYQIALEAIGRMRCIC